MRRNLLSLWLLAFLVCFISIYRAYPQENSDTSLTALTERAYSLISSNPRESITLFRKAIERDPSNIQLKRQIGYLYLSQQKNENALEQFEASEKIRSSDTVKLQIAYIFAEMQQRNDALDMFNDLQKSNDLEIREKASKGISSLASERIRLSWWGQVYAVTYYDTRWNDWFYDAFVKHGVYLTEDKLLSAYAVLSLSGDSRSSGGATPQIFSDNTLMGALGIRLNPFYGFLFDMQYGAAYDIIDKHVASRVHQDFRAVAIYSNGVYAPFTLHDDLRMPFYPTAEIYASAGNYSRYETNIAYVQMKAGLRAIEALHTLVDAYARVNVSRDARGAISFDLASSMLPIQEKRFYNNVVESGFGVRVTPHNEWGLYIDVEYLRGTYWGLPDAEIPQSVDRWYNSVRGFIIFERTF